MKKLSFIVFLFTFFFAFTHPVLPQDRFAVCDLCGYCPPNPPPSNWVSCKSCVYPEALSSDPSIKETLKIDPTDNTPPTPFPGNHYTMIGCVSTNLGSFSKPGAAASVVQILLNLVFGIIGGLALLYLLYGAFIILTSQQEAEKISYGKSIIYGAIIGLVFSLSSVFIINFIAGKVLRIPGF